MKYPKWDEYTEEQKFEALYHELNLDTHKGTTKEDLLNILNFVVEYNHCLEANESSITGVLIEIKELIQHYGEVNLLINFNEILEVYGITIN